ncbi:nitroreductase family protein [Parablautia muri]|uniref:Nitroreductase n=1 Tax=Parablautia muri TaxID=2320879 RepID=A0A9X5BEQ7_9FIRM|nr:nitroreductase family protein [Parablautia muri]NBJ92451.1 nitroreductase [Parablautia muri]
MNEIIRDLHRRKSVRVFTDQEITSKEKKEILYAAMAAPTAGNQQLYTILDITDEELKKKLSVTCDHQPFIAKAKMVLVFCADLQKWYDVFLEGGCTPRRPGAGDLMLAVSDTNIAAQNAVTAAQSMGIGSCYIGDIMENCEVHRELLNLPEYVFPAAMLVFGYPTDQQQERQKPVRCRLEDIVQENGYRRKSSDELRRMFDKKCQSVSFEEWSRCFCERKYNSDFAREMSRSVRVYLEAFADQAANHGKGKEEGSCGN